MIEKTFKINNLLTQIPETLKLMTLEQYKDLFSIIKDFEDKRMHDRWEVERHIRFIEEALGNLLVVIDDHQDRAQDIVLEIGSVDIEACFVDMAEAGHDEPWNRRDLKIEEMDIPF